MIIIPAIDIYENKTVRLSKGDFDNVTFYKNPPLKQAEIYKSFGFNHIHIVDLLGSKTGKLSALQTVTDIKEYTGLIIQFGGGIRDVKTVTQLFDAGVDYAVIGSLPVKNKDEFKLILEKHSPDKIIIAADFKFSPEGGEEKIAISGWTEETELSLSDHIKNNIIRGIRRFICTDISKDGMLSGPNINLYKKLIDENPGIKLIASGGVKDINDIKKLKEINPYSVVIGKAIYENKIDLKELSELALS